MAVGLNKADLRALFDERGEIFKEHLIKQLTDCKVPLKFQMPLPRDGSVTLDHAPEFQQWMAEILVKASVCGMAAFVDTLTTDSPSTSKLDSLHKDNEALHLLLNRAHKYIVELGGAVEPIDWPKYESDDMPPWSTSPD